jgi:hypothetical protein
MPVIASQIPQNSGKNASDAVDFNQLRLSNNPGFQLTDPFSMIFTRVTNEIVSDSRCCFFEILRRV